MYLQSKLREEIKRAQKTPKKIRYPNRIKDRDATILQKAVELIDTYKNRVTTYSIKSADYPLLKALSRNHTTNIFNLIGNPPDFENLNFARLMHEPLSTYLANEIVGHDSDEFNFGAGNIVNQNINLEHLKHLAENLNSILKVNLTEEDTYKIICNYDSSDTNNIKSIRAVVLQAYYESPIILIETNSHIIKLHDKSILCYEIFELSDEDMFEFHGEEYPVARESLQIIDWVHFGAGYFSVTFNQPNSCN